MNSPTLEAAAGNAFDNLAIRFAAGQLKVQLTLFCSLNARDFPDTAPGGRQVSNWFAVLWAIATNMDSGTPPLSQLTPAADALYRLCWMANYLQGTGGITNEQALGLLGSYNSVIAIPDP